MKNLMTKFVIVLATTTLGFAVVRAQNDMGSATPDSGTASGLDLYAVAELFKDSENIEKFEQALNDPAKGLNNLDLNNDNQIDFIRAAEQLKDDTRLIILQSRWGKMTIRTLLR